MIKACGLPLYSAAAASTRYRLTQYVPGLRDNNIDLDILPLLPDQYIARTYGGHKYSISRIASDYLSRLSILMSQNKYDIAIIQAELLPLFPGMIESRLLRIPYIYDFDDALYLKYSSERFRKVSFLLNNKFDSVVRQASAVLAGSRHLAEFAARNNPNTVLLPTVVDTERYFPGRYKNPEIFTVGWIGSPTTSVYLRELVEPLKKLGSESKVRFVVVGGRCGHIDNVEVVNLPWADETEVELINSFDVGVMPLFDDAWARGKCAFKLIQYMACALPVVASPVGANVEVASPDCGYQAVDCADWVGSLRKLRDDKSLRLAMGQAGRRRVEAHYSLNTALPIMTETIRSVAGGKR